jgi:sugar O-acyltransferase (sialic acid O-acetyltransferase NeuD family)
VNLPIIVVGGSGHAKVLVSTLLLEHRAVLGFVDPDPSLPPILGIRRLGEDNEVLRHAPDRIRLVNGVGSGRSTELRKSVYARFREKQYVFEAVIHPSASIAPDVQAGDGLQVMAGAVVQTGVRLGENVILNTGTIIDHDCVIGDHVHVAPGAILSGCVHLDQGVHVGTGASIIQGIRVGAASTVGAGAVVLHDVAAGITVVGVPAKELLRTSGAGR